MASKRAQHTAQSIVLLETLQGYGLTDAELAQVIGAQPGQQIRWGGGRVSPAAIQHRLERIHDIAFLLSDSFQTRSAVGAWFRANNRILRGYTPLEMIALGSYEQVLAAAAALADGAYV